VIERDLRAAILTLQGRGLGATEIARAVGVARNTVRAVLASGSAEVPRLERPEQLTPFVDLVRDLHVRCKGNLVRVHEELEGQRVVVAYSTLTSFCRRHEIGVKPKERAGRYHFEPGEEMQHDTSPHDVEIGGRIRRVQCASLVLCFCRMLFAQLYERWTRFEVRVFLTQALIYLGGAASRCMLDNSSVIIASGTGANAVPAPAMLAFADRFDFSFAAHELGDANRSARVERPFDHIERNFYAGREFCDLADANRQLIKWCDRSNACYRKHLKASPIELYAIDRAALKPLPAFIPEVYDLHSRRVDIEGYVTLHRNRYSVDTHLIGRQVEVRETIDRVRIFDGHQLAEEHDKAPFGAGARLTLEKHRGQTRRRKLPPPPTPIEEVLREQGPAFVALIEALRKRHGGRALRAVRELHRLWRDYPTEALHEAITEALTFGLTDVPRIEHMVLRRLATTVFNLPLHDQDHDETR